MAFPYASRLVATIECMYETQTIPLEEYETIQPTETIKKYEGLRKTIGQAEAPFNIPMMMRIT